MIKYIAAAALLLTFTAPSMAETATTIPTGGATVTTTTDYYVVRDPSAKDCDVTSAKPQPSSTTVVVGNTAYKTWEEARAAVATVCR